MIFRNIAQVAFAAGDYATLFRLERRARCHANAESYDASVVNELYLAVRHSRNAAVSNHIADELRALAIELWQIRAN